MALTKVRTGGFTAGSVLQVVSTTKDDVFTHDQTTEVDITNLTASITPFSTSSKVLVTVHIGSHGRDGNGDLVFRIKRGSTAIGQGASGTFTATMASRSVGELSDACSMMFLDSPSSASSTAYKVTVQQSGSGNLKVNGRQPDASFGTISSITLMEIAG